MNQRIQEKKEDYRFDSEELMGRRDVSVETIKEKKFCLEKGINGLIVQSIKTYQAFLKEETKKTESEIRDILDKKARKIKEVLISRKGMGEQTTANLTASRPEVGKSENRQITKPVGLAPMAHESGKMRSERHIRGCRTRVGNALFAASVSTVRSNEKVSEFYKNLRNRDKSAHVAVAHKLLIIINSKMRAFFNNKNFFRIRLNFNFNRDFFPVIFLFSLNCFSQCPESFQFR